MRIAPSIRGPRVWQALLAGALLATWALAQPHPTEPPSVDHPLGWSEGQVAAGTAATLTPQEPVTLDIPTELPRHQVLLASLYLSQAPSVLG